MAMKCPKCQHPIAKDANGRYPTRCPGCRVALRIVPSGENVAPEKSEDGHQQAKGPHFSKKCKQTAAARPIRRNFESDERSEEQSRRPTAKRTARLGQYENESEEDELDDFDSRRRSRSVERPLPRYRRDEDNDNEYSPKQRRRSRRKFVDDEGSIFGTTRFQNRPSTDDNDDSVYFWPACLIVLLAVCLTGLVFRDTLMEKLRSDKPAAVASLQNVSRRYSLALPNGRWQLDESRNEAGVDAVFRHAKLRQANITIVSGAAQDQKTCSPNELVAKLVQEWSGELDDFVAAEPQEASLSDRQAVRISGQGKRRGIPTSREAFVFACDGMWYQLIFSAPESEFQSLAEDFRQTRNGFAILPNKNDPTELSGDHAGANSKSRVVAGKKYPYQIVVGKSWKENDDLQGSLLADLKMISADHHATVVVSAAKNTTAEDRLRKFIHRKEKQFDRVTLQTPADGEPAEVAGWPALRIVAKVESDGVKSDVIASVYFKAGEYVYEIECRTDAERLQQFDTEFSEIIQSFKSLDANPPTELAAAPANEVGTVEPAKSTDSTTSTLSKPTVTPEPPNETAGAAKSNSAPARNLGPNGDIRDAKTGESAAAKSRVSLDDLD